jgi:hypothetical protein
LGFVSGPYLADGKLCKFLGGLPPGIGWRLRDAGTHRKNTKILKRTLHGVEKRKKICQNLLNCPFRGDIYDVIILRNVHDVYDRDVFDVHDDTWDACDACDPYDACAIREVCVVRDVLWRSVKSIMEILLISITS